MALADLPRVTHVMDNRGLSDTLAMIAKELEFVLNGRIDFRNVKADGIEAKNLKAGSVTADKIEAGAVTADKIDVNELSAISANLGTITAGWLQAVTIIGSLIQTQLSGNYPRAEMSATDNAFKVEYSSGRSIEIRPDVVTGVPVIRLDNGTVAGQIAPLTTATGGIDAIQIESLLAHLKLKATLDIILSAVGSVRVDSWSKLKSDGASQTLQQALDAKAPAFSGYTGGIPAGASLICLNGVVLNYV